MRLNSAHCLGRSELGDGFGALRHGMLCELAGKHQPDSGLDLSGGESHLLVVTRQLASLPSDALENIIDERVHDRHAALGDTGVRMDLLQDFVDVHAV